VADSECAHAIFWQNEAVMLRRWAIVGAALGASFGCGALLDVGAYTIVDGGAGACEAGTLLNACTDAACVSFDNARLAKLLPDGGLPALPARPDGGKMDSGAPGLPEGGLPLCSKVNPGKPIVYVSGTAQSYVSALARVLFSAASAPLTIIYQGNSSCVAWDSIINGTPITGTGSYWDPASTSAASCSLPAKGVVPDVGVADIFASTCTSLPDGLPHDIGDFFGPVQTMSFVVPKVSTQQSISAQAAYLVYGYGAGGGVSPWTRTSNILHLDGASGTQRMIAAAIGVPTEQWQGKDLLYSSMEIDALTSVSAADAPSTIGILAVTNVVGDVPTSINVLAYQHYGQSCGYYPDSSPAGKDKRNVRDGHYAIWGPVHIMSRTQGGYPVNPDAKRVVEYWTGTMAPPSGVDLIQVDAVNNLVPTCAMRVQRRTEMGPLSTFSPPNPCGCYFEAQAGQTGCQACTTASSCPASTPTCSFGYCEGP
jgi:hypothetical protein